MLTLLLALWSPWAPAEETQSVLQVEYKESDLDASWDDAQATHIALDGQDATVDGDGATIADGVLSIVEPGDYVLSGTFSGRIEVEVDKEENEKVRLVFDGVALETQTLPAVFCRQADKITLTLAEGSQNTITARGEAATEDDEALDAAVYSKADMVINGGGSLLVTSDMHGILSKDDMIVTGGTLEIDAGDDGLRGKDAVEIGGGTLTIRALGDGVKANNDSDPERGYVSIDGGSLTVESEQDGVQAETTLQITAGTVHIVAGGGAGAAWDAGDETSRKGLKAGTRLTVTGGEITVDSFDDALHSNADVYVSGGTITLSTGDDAIHGDADVTVADGVIEVLEAYEGIEGVDVVISGGEIGVVCSDDAINAAGGTEEEGTTADAQNAWGPWGRGGEDQFAVGDYSICVTGGSLVLEAGGDGMDSNGIIEMSGGTLFIGCPAMSGDSAIDVNGTMTLTGGVLVSLGSSQMAQVPDSDSQAVPAASVDGAQGGQAVSLRDASGRTLVSFTPSQSWQHAVFSLPEMTVGETYGIYLDDTLALEVELTDLVTSQGGAFGMPGGGWGGGQGGRRGDFDSQGGTRFRPDGAQGMMPGEEEMIPPEGAPEDMPTPPDGMPTPPEGAPALPGEAQPSDETEATEEPGGGIQTDPEENTL